MREEAIEALGLFVTIVVLAALVNRYRAAHRVHIRRLVILFALYVAAETVHHALGLMGSPAWATRFGVAGELVEAFTVVNIASTAIFSVVLPATGLVFPTIAGDLLVGIGYIAATL